MVCSNRWIFASMKEKPVSRINSISLSDIPAFFSRSISTSAYRIHGGFLPEAQGRFSSIPYPEFVGRP